MTLIEAIRNTTGTDTPGKADDTMSVRSVRFAHTTDTVSAGEKIEVRPRKKYTRLQRFLETLRAYAANEEPRF